MDPSVRCLRACRLSEGWGPPFILSAKIWGCFSAWGGREVEGAEQGGEDALQDLALAPPLLLHLIFPRDKGGDALQLCCCRCPPETLVF